MFKVYSIFSKRSAAPILKGFSIPPLRAAAAMFAQFQARERPHLF
jgi:hypothetical protein